MFRRIFGAGAALGAGLAYFFDPDSGNRRRHAIGERAEAFLRRSGHRAERAGRAVGAQVYGLDERAATPAPPDRTKPTRSGDRSGGFLRRSGDRAERAGRAVGAHAYGMGDGEPPAAQP